MFRRITTSFSTRLNVYLISSILLLATVSFAMFHRLATGYLEKNIYHHIHEVAEKIDLKLAVLLKATEKTADNLRWLIGTYNLPPDSLYHLTHRLVAENEEIFGCSIAFEPFYFKSKGCYFAPYSYMKGDSVVTTQLGRQEHDYFHKKWYNTSRRNQTPVWSKSFSNKTKESIPISSYSTPIFDQHHTLIGVFSLDLATTWITDMINALKPEKASHILIVDPKGNYIAGKKEFWKTSSVASPDIDTAASKLALQMKTGEKGKTVIRHGGQKFYVFYTPLSSIEWYLGIVYPYPSLYISLRRFNIIALLCFISLLLLIYLICTFTVRRLTRPLQELTVYTQNIGEGNFHASLPLIKSQDETRELYDSFREMQNKLNLYIHNLRQTTALQEKIDSELRIAHEIQMGMLPKKFPTFPEKSEIELAAVLYPARQVGGDLYDFYFKEDLLYFAIGDVSGKGIPASLMMSVTISLLRSARKYSPATIINQLNASISEHNEADMFVTLFVGILHLKTGEMRYCNAGHMPPVITYPNKEVELLPIQPDLPVGILADHVYQEYAYHFSPGSGLLLYTDGVTDAENPQGKFYTQTRLLHTIRQNHSYMPQQFIQNIVADIRAHQNGQDPNDDMTLLTFIYGKEWVKKDE